MERLSLTQACEKMGISRVSLNKLMREQGIKTSRSGKIQTITIDQYEVLRAAQKRTLPPELLPTPTIHEILPALSTTMDPSVERLVRTLETQIEFLKHQLRLEENSTADTASLEIELLHEHIRMLKTQLAEMRDRERMLLELNQTLTENNIKLSESYNQIHQLLVKTQEANAELRTDIRTMETLAEEASANNTPPPLPVNENRSMVSALLKRTLPILGRGASVPPAPARDKQKNPPHKNFSKNKRSS
ncbi:MAG: hypothetical protein HQM12_01115 [SAR324 cluster bacterium]|nr:hypothetical protein [SAR324 cluster bacterium]